MNVCVAMGLVCVGEVFQLPILEQPDALPEHPHPRLQLESLIPLSLFRCVTDRDTCGCINFLHFQAALDLGRENPSSVPLGKST